MKRSSSNEIYHHHDVKNKLRKTKQNKRAKQFSTTDKSQTVHKRKEKEKKNQKRKQKKLQKAKAQNTINDKFFKKQFALLCLNKSFNGFVETETETVVCHSDFLSHTRV